MHENHIIWASECEGTEIKFFELENLSLSIIVRENSKAEGQSKRAGMNFWICRIITISPRHSRRSSASI